MPDAEERRPGERAASESTATTTSSSLQADGSDERRDASSALYRTSPVKRCRRSKAQLEELHNAILTACELDHPLTVRGVFYRVLSAGAVEKTEKAYNAVQREVLKLRRSGDLPYEWVVDGTRWHIKTPSWSNVEEALDDAAASYRRALWHDQDVYVEIWSEKDAISSIIAPVTETWDVPLMVARGFASESFLWSTASTIRAVNKPTIVYQLGDHDPSGIAAWKHVQRRLREFAPDIDIYFERLAVTPEQIYVLDLPTRPTKATDSRSKGFIGESVEVDAIPTSTLTEIVANAITRHIDPRTYRLHKMVEEQERAGLAALASGWSA